MVVCGFGCTVVLMLSTLEKSFGFTALTRHARHGSRLVRTPATLTLSRGVHVLRMAAATATSTSARALVPELELLVAQAPNPDDLDRFFTELGRVMVQHAAGADTVVPDYLSDWEESPRAHAPAIRSYCIAWFAAVRRVLDLVMQPSSLRALNSIGAFEPAKLLVKFSNIEVALADARKTRELSDAALAVLLQFARVARADLVASTAFVARQCMTMGYISAERIRAVLFTPPMQRLVDFSAQFPSLSGASDEEESPDE